MHQVLQANALISAEQLDEQYSLGWRLITIVQVDGVFYFYFERI